MNYRPWTRHLAHTHLDERRPLARRVFESFTESRGTIDTLEGDTKCARQKLEVRVKDFRHELLTECPALNPLDIAEPAVGEYHRRHIQTIAGRGGGSCMPQPKPPSPLSETTRCPGLPTAAPSEVGNPYPRVPW